MPRYRWRITAWLALDRDVSVAVHAVTYDARDQPSAARNCSRHAASQHDGLEPGIAAREPRLERLVPSPEPVLGRALGDRAADGVSHEEKADRVALECRIAASLVVARDGPDLEAVPHRDRATAELEHPEPQPAAVECLTRDLALERRVVEVGRRRAPTCAVEREQRVEVVVERRGVGEARLDLSFSAERGVSPAQLLAEVRAPRREVLLPARREVEGGACLGPPQAGAEALGPAFVAGKLLTEEDVPVELLERRPDGTGCNVWIAAMDRAELVARAVPEEAQHAREAPSPGIQRNDECERAVGRSRRVEEELAVAPVVVPPQPAPECGLKDAAGALGKLVPFALAGSEPVHGLRTRYNFGRSAMTEVRAHPSLSKRLVRPVARLVGVPVGVTFMLLLRLTGRKAGVALMYHSVDRRAGDPARELVPPHEAALFESQLHHIVRHYEVVPADRLLEAVATRRRGRRFPVAITFDDDLASHATIAAPTLRGLGVSGTFFLSGASLDGPFSFHFERLQRAWDTGVPDLPALVTGTTTGPTSLHGLGVAMADMSPGDRDRTAERLLAQAGPDPADAGIRREQVRELVAGGMTVGFHTFRHDPLTGLSDAQLAEAMQRGRGDLADVTGAPVDVIGYPHGRADERVAAAARAAGFRFGYSTRRVPVTPASNPWLLGRFGPSLRSVGALALELAFTLVKRESGRPSPAPERAPS
jgi:peptidoglycan/xylan/chitin deacetylase (PgdA/CDA1 family)